MCSSLFDEQSPPSDLDFAALLDGPDDYREQRDFIDRLWSVYEPYADSHFPTEIRKSFLQRYWEMYLTCTLLDQGFIVKSEDIGPDLHVSRDGISGWVEAIAATPGQGPDAVEPFPGRGVAKRIPSDQVTLRLTAAFIEKFRKYEKYLANNVVAAHEPFVIAINGVGVPYWQMDSRVPRVVTAVLPFGTEYVTINRKTLAVVGGGHEYRSEIVKLSGRGVPTTVFEESKYSGISAVLYSTAHIWSSPLELGHLLYLIHNPMAANPIPRGSISVGVEYWIQGDMLIGKASARSSD